MFPGQHRAHGRPAPKESPDAPARSVCHRCLHRNRLRDREEARRGRGFTVYAGARRVEKMEPLKALRDQGPGAGRDGRGVHERRRRTGARGARPDRCPGQQRRLRFLRLAGGSGPGRGPAAVRRQRLRPGADDAAGDSRPCGQAGAGQDHQHLLDRRKNVRAARRLVPRHEVRRRGPQRFAAARAQAARHRRVHHRARRHQSEWGAIAAQGLLASSGGRALRGPGQGGGGGAGLHRQAGDVHAARTVMAEAIVHAATAPRPKTRYPVGAERRGPSCCCAGCCRTGRSIAVCWNASTSGSGRSLRPGTSAMQASDLVFDQVLGRVDGGFGLALRVAVPPRGRARR